MQSAQADWLLALTGAFWLPMTAAIVVSAANGGTVPGLVATIVSAALVGGSSSRICKRSEARSRHTSFALAVFLAIGFAVSPLHEKLHRLRAGLARTARQNHSFAALIENSLDFIGIADPEGKPLYLDAAGRQMVESPNDIELEQTKSPTTTRLTCAHVRPGFHLAGDAVAGQMGR